MAATAFSVWNSEVISADDPGITVVAGQTVRLRESAQISNSPGPTPSLEITLNYEQTVPDITDGSPPFTLGCVVEQRDVNGNWRTIAYQFTPHRNSEGPPERTIVMQPDMPTADAGIDDSVFPVDREVARISRQQGALKENVFRVVLLLVDNDPDGPNAFQSVTVSCAGERYDHVS